MLARLVIGGELISRFLERAIARRAKARRCRTLAVQRNLSPYGDAASGALIRRYFPPPASAAQRPARTARSTSIRRLLAGALSRRTRRHSSRAASG
jgi:hypothetical protein